MEVKTSTYGATLDTLGNDEVPTQVQTAETTTQAESAIPTTEGEVAAAETTTTETTTPAQEENVTEFSLGISEEEIPKPEVKEPAPTFNLDEELKKIDRKEVLKKLGVNEFAVEIDEYLAKGGRAEDYITAKAVDYNRVSDEDLIKESMRKQFPDFTKEDIDRRFNRKYGTSDPNLLDDEKEARLDDLKADGYLLRKQKQSEQQSFKIPDTPILPKDEAYEQWKQQKESQPQLMEQLRNFYTTHEATKALNESKRVAVNLGDGVAPFNFSVDRPELITQMYTDGGELWQKVTSTKTGEPDVQKQQLIGLFAFNPQKFIQDIFTYGQKMGVRKELVEEGQNAQRPQAKIAQLDTSTTPNISLGKFGDRARN